MKNKKFKIKTDLYIRETDNYFKKGTRFYMDSDIEHSETAKFICGYFETDKGKVFRRLDIDGLKELKASKLSVLHIFFFIDAASAALSFYFGQIFTGLVFSIGLVFTYLLILKKDSDKKNKNLNTSQPYNALSSIRAAAKNKPNRLKKIWYKFRPYWRGFLLKVYNRSIEAVILFILLTLLNQLK